MHMKKVAVNFYLGLCYGHFPVNVGESMLALTETRTYLVKNVS